MVLVGAAGAWKEPQSLILFSLNAGSVDAMVNLSGYNEHYYFQPKMDQRLEGPAASFLEVNPLAADENFGAAAIGWVMGRLAGTLALNPVLGQSHAAYIIIRGIEAAAKERAGFMSSKRTTIPAFSPSRRTSRTTPRPCSMSSSASTVNTFARRRRSPATTA